MSNPNVPLSTRESIQVVGVGVENKTVQELNPTPPRLQTNEPGYQDRLILYLTAHARTTGEDLPPSLQAFLLNYEKTPTEGYQEKLLLFYIFHVTQTGEELLPSLKAFLEQDHSKITFETHRSLNSLYQEVAPSVEDITEASHSIKQMTLDCINQVNPVVLDEYRKSLENAYANSSNESDGVNNFKLFKQQLKRLESAIDCILLLSQKYKEINEALKNKLPDLYRELNIIENSHSIVKLMNELSYYRFYIVKYASESNLHYILTESRHPVKTLRRLMSYLDDVPETAHTLQTCLNDVVIKFRSKIQVESGI